MINIKNSSGKIIGYVDIIDDKIIIHNNSKPELVIENNEILSAILKKDRNDDIIIKLYDEYYLTIGEIAALYDVCYSNMNKQIRHLNVKTTQKANRRNSSYKLVFSQTRRENISKALKEGYETKRIIPKPYVRTPEIKEKISKSLKKYFSEHPQNPTPHINNWKNGVYDNVDFHIGIGGSFYSYKNGIQINFRSLLELFYFLLLEKDDSISSYKYEPIHIVCDNGHVYTPDILINDTIVELKSKRYIEKVPGVKQKVLYKKEQAEKYCKEHNLKYQIIYDEDIGYESKKFKRYLNNNPDIMNYYQIKINQPKRMVIK